MSFPNLESLLSCFRGLGVRSVYAKPLAENDNSKQQIYFGGSFEVLGQLPFVDLREEAGGRRPNFKARLNLHWIDASGNSEPAAGSQLILYPDYPEVRLSGFLRGCSIAPSSDMQPLARELRSHSNGPDGRVLFLGVSQTGVVFAYLGVRESAVSHEFRKKQAAGGLECRGVLWEIPITVGLNNRYALIERIRQIHRGGWYTGRRLNRDGHVVAYTARNGGGYTLEALLGIRPNAISAPDLLGYEIKAYSSTRVTLMTPEPDTGLYGEEGVEVFVRRYGRPVGNDTLYFTGSHRVNETCPSSGQILRLEGFDQRTGKILSVTGGVMLYDADGNLSAGWSFKGLMEHWGRKHASAAYIPFENDGLTSPSYFYKSPILIGEGTAFEMYLKAMDSGKVIYDPGSKVMAASTACSTVKARSQFRISVRELSRLYKDFQSVSI